MYRNALDIQVDLPQRRDHPACLMVQHAWDGSRCSVPYTGVPHNDEVPYVWGWPLLKLNPAIRRESGIILDLIRWDEVDEVYTDYIQTMWANFAKYG